MSFLSQFSTYFTAQQRDTELYQLWAQIGVNMEKALLEEMTAKTAEMADINNFSEDTMRSWLGFFLERVPYRTSATVQVTTKLTKGYKQVTIPRYSELTTDEGVKYTQMNEMVLASEDVRTSTAVQGVRVVESGTYSTLIKVQATNPDLTYLTVKLNGEEIPEVSYETSYDNLMYQGSWKPETMPGETFGGTPHLQNAYGEKGKFYTVIADGEACFSEGGVKTEFRKGDLVVFDGDNWQRSAANNRLMPIQFMGTYAMPSNGWFAYYYNNYLYIKVFQGTEVDNPEGKRYEVAYISSDGVQGEVKENALSYVDQFEDSDENVVTLEVSNTKSTTAVNEPSVGKLGLYLKRRLYSSINVSSVPEYTAWFKAQPEVGDCMVLSDWERYIRSGRTKMDVTGVVEAYIVDPNGNELSDGVKEALLDRLEPFKDVAVVTITSFTPVKNWLIFKYTSTDQDDQFQQYVKATASQYYVLSYLQSTNSSIFDDLDLTEVLKDVLDNSPYISTGLTLKGYHYQTYPIGGSDPDGWNLLWSDRVIRTESYAGEKCGTGFYKLTTPDGEEYEFEEVELATSANASEIYYKGKDSYERVGEHTETTVSVDLDILAEKGILSEWEGAAKFECWWGMENEGSLAIGAPDGMRKLSGITVEKAGGQ